MNSSGKVEVLSPAKLTLSLRITGQREEDGYHLIQSEMVTIDLVDSISIEEGGRRVIYKGLYPIEPAPDEDLVLRALNLLDVDVTVTVHKLIPPKGGLGGGSGNAAAILRHFGFTDPKSAVQLGADVPFNLCGGRAIVRGIGEIIEQRPFEERIFTLLMPTFGCSTAAVYEKWDQLGGPSGQNGNDLEPAAVELHPELSKWRDKLEKHSGEKPKLAGSGSTWFVEGDYPGEGFVIARSLPPTD
ncbi:MAG: 4-(cytidine 5'-diphospho)-2-C-methyl-D-erythritol kinase [Actinomycetota bacterium]|nr:4-(cytidine 5'-diphospho)-2-C-methyl-D-erythritol kinase [Actinomycetota bacterium]